MSQYLLIERITVQNANAVSGFTWGFPAITHFLGFSHLLQRKLQSDEALKQLVLEGCVVIAHEQHVHTYKDGNNTRFSQNKTAHYLGLTFTKGLLRDPAINEEAKMNMVVSLLIPVQGYLGGIQDELIDFIRQSIYTQRLAGGTILQVKNVELINLSEDKAIRPVRNKLLPGFVLQDRATYLEQHLLKLQQINPEAELLDAWFDFVTLKQVARPACDRIDAHFSKLSSQSEAMQVLNEKWLNHKEHPYCKDAIPQELMDYFQELQNDKSVSEQWQNYLQPTEKKAADWEYIRKPEAGFLVPLMVGYKAITDVFSAGEVDGSRDVETDFCFVEALHSVGEWQSVHRLRTTEQWQNSVWEYTYDSPWYVCQQAVKAVLMADDVHDFNDDDYNS